MSDSDLKVTDKRMFTPDGDLREEFRHLEDSSDAATEAAESVAPPSPEATADAAEAPDLPPPSPAADPAVESGEAGAPPLEIPSTPRPGELRPTFLDLLTALAQPAAVYLGDLPLPDGSSAEDLELARLHIDLIEILREKTRGNLDAQELAVIDDTLYRLRMRHVQKRE